MKKYFKSIFLVYIAIALFVSGYLFINPPLTTREYRDSYDAREAANVLPKGHRFVKISSYRDMKNGRDYAELITYNDNSFKYSLLFFSVGGLVLYAIFLFKKAKD